MTIAELLDQVLADSRERLCTEIHSNGDVAISYAHSLWALENDLRQLSDRIREGALQ
ncbi:hypothetical protein [Prescottella agglutinans]|uniref:Uncharacterized protein n=1 Tax=Prescottella agglutinans TaxID=1644129 RepID=A0ABT6MH97_9NOCA|nr:hypothetical protein [Prescottella agglutinans]MDH6283250.1 hypothetical protein [Prescottella agglutinans]